MRAKTVFLPLLLLVLAASGCDSSAPEGEGSVPIEGGSSIPSEGGSSIPSEGSAESSSTSRPGQSSISTLTSEPSEVSDIISHLTAEGGRYIKRENPDSNTEREFTFSYLGSLSFRITAISKDTFNDETYSTTVRFEWGSLAGTAIEGSAATGEDIFEAVITATYGNVPSITLSSYAVVQTTVEDKEMQDFYASLLLSIQKEGFTAIQNYVKGINSAYSLW